MGFQSSFNQLLATASAGALGARHIQGQKISEKIAAGEEYQREYDSSMDLSKKITSHNNQLEPILKGIDVLNEKAKQGKMSRKAYEKAFQAQLEQGSMIYDQNQELIARKKILEERILANVDTVIKNGYGKSPIPKIPEVKDMRKNDPIYLNEADANWKKPRSPKKEEK